MSDTPPVLCRLCGGHSSDLEWCEHCGADIKAQALTDRGGVAWLQPGEVVTFRAIGVRKGPSGSFSRVRTEVRSPRSLSAEEDEAEDEEIVPVGVPTPSEAVAASGAFEIIGATDSDLSSQELATEEKTKPVVDHGVFEIIGQPAGVSAFERESAHPLDLEDLPLLERNPPQVELSIEVLGPREVYSHRRLWLAREHGTMDEAHHFLVEERQLREDTLSETSLHLPDEIESRYLYPSLSRIAHEGRLLTLYHVPLGQSLLSWRQRQESPRYSSILIFLRPLVEAIERIHASARLHLHIAPQNVWFHQGKITFTGLESFANDPFDGSSYRAYPGFSAPEKLGRSRAAIGPHSDIYGLGALTYFLITGTVPPVAPETAFSPALSPRDFQPEFPMGWVDAILRATDPVPDRRQASPSEFLQALETAALLIQQRSAPRATVRCFAAAERHIGFNKAKRSPINQDQVFLRQNERLQRLLVVVGDGVSTASYGSGDLASACLAKRAEQHWNRIASLEILDSPEQVIADIIRESNQDIVDYVNANHAPILGAPSEVMGSTALVGIIEKGTLHLGALGDSRCYLIRHEHMECMTRDHNLFTLSLIEGISLSDVLLMPHGDALAKCLGTFELDKDRRLHALTPLFDFYTLNLLPKDNLLLCTDGLFDYAGSTYEESESNIREIVLGEYHPGIACLELLVLANRGGGGDNIGVALVKVS